MTTFTMGDLVVLIDAKERRYLETLESGGEFHSHHGVVSHESISGMEEGSVVESTMGARYTMIRPTLEDFVLRMPRGAQVIYPKDLAQILMLLDVRQGEKIYETGVGSGALSMALLRAGAHVTGYEIREDFAARARKNIESFLGVEAAGRHRVRIADAYEVAPNEIVDKVALDIPEPWRVVPLLSGCLRRGGLMVAYTPSITQAQQVRDVLGDDWMDVRTLETLVRTWHIEGLSVRPDHRMVAHTAFLTVGRFVGDGPTAR